MKFIYKGRSENNYQSPTPFVMHRVGKMKKSVQTLPSPPSQPEIKAPSKKEMLWGEPTWFLFHTLAEKVKDEYSQEIKNELFSFIRRICNNLPCPDCAKHATQYMKTINFDVIRTKEQLKLMLFNFHNDVSKRKGNPVLEYVELDEKYNSAITINIARNFFHHFSRRSYNLRIDVSGNQRRTLMRDFKSWLQLHHYCFDE